LIQYPHFANIGLLWTTRISRYFYELTYSFNLGGDAGGGEDTEAHICAIVRKLRVFAGMINCVSVRCIFIYAALDLLISLLGCLDNEIRKCLCFVTPLGWTNRSTLSCSMSFFSKRNILILRRY
jgi:hypothetical protein